MVWLILFDSVLASHMGLEIGPFFLSCPICWSITVHNIVINFCITIVSVVISSLSFLILFIWVLCFLLGEPGQRFVDIVYPFKHQLLVFLIFLVFFNL